MAENLIKRFGQKIRELREDAGLKQGDFAKMVGINQSDLSAFENHGRKIQSIETIEKMLNVLGFTLEPSQKKTLLPSL